MYMEDRLRHLYYKSLLLSRVIDTKPDELWTFRAAAAAIGWVYQSKLLKYGLTIF